MAKNKKKEVVINDDDNYEEIWEKIKNEKSKNFKKRFTFHKEKNYITAPAEKRQISITMTKKNLRLSFFLLVFSFVMFMVASFFALSQKSAEIYGVKLTGEFYELDSRSANQINKKNAYKVSSGVSLSNSEVK